VISGFNYDIDEVVSSGLYTPTAFILSATVKSITSLETYNSPTTYTLEITPNKVIN